MIKLFSEKGIKLGIDLDVLEELKKINPISSNEEPKFTEQQLSDYFLNAICNKFIHLEVLEALIDYYAINFKKDLLDSFFLQNKNKNKNKNKDVIIPKLAGNKKILSFLAEKNPASIAFK